MPISRPEVEAGDLRLPDNAVAVAFGHHGDAEPGPHQRQGAVVVRVRRLNSGRTPCSALLRVEKGEQDSSGSGLVIPAKRAARAAVE